MKRRRLTSPFHPPPCPSAGPNSRLFVLLRPHGWLLCYCIGCFIWQLPSPPPFLLPWLYRQKNESKDKEEAGFLRFVLLAQAPIRTVLTCLFCLAPWVDCCVYAYLNKLQWWPLLQSSSSVARGKGAQAQQWFLLIMVKSGTMGVQPGLVTYLFIILSFITGFDPFWMMAMSAAAVKRLRCRHGRRGARATVCHYHCSEFVKMMEQGANTVPFYNIVTNSGCRR